MFGSLKVTCVHVSLACPISSDMFIHARRSEESLEKIRIFTETIIKKTIRKSSRNCPLCVSECVRACVRACVQYPLFMSACVGAFVRACIQHLCMCPCLYPYVSPSVFGYFTCWVMSGWDFTHGHAANVSRWVWFTRLVQRRHLTLLPSCVSIKRCTLQKLYHGPEDVRSIHAMLALAQRHTVMRQTCLFFLFF